jgi:hypothetical protein
MIDQLARDVAANLRARKFPVQVFYGPERVTREGLPSHVLVFARDTERDESFTTPRGTQRNPRRYRTRTLYGVVDVFAKATVKGARTAEHERLCDQLVDGLATALVELSASGQRPPVEIVGGRLLTAAELRDADIPAGAAYRMRFTWERGVELRDYDGSADDTATLAAVDTASRVTLDGTNYEDI